MQIKQISQKKIREQINLYKECEASIIRSTEAVNALEENRKNAIHGTKNQFDEDIKKAKTLVTAAKDSFQKVSRIIYETKSDYTDEYDTLFATIAVCRKTNQGARGQIVGSVVEKMYESTFISKLSEVLNKDADQEMKTRVSGIITFMQKYSQIRLFLKYIHNFKNSEIDDLKTKCDWLGKNFPLLFPDRAITPKLHMLFIHVPQFAAKHKNLGLFSESAFESLHGEFNHYDRVYACVTNTGKSMQLQMACAEIRRSPRVKKTSTPKEKVYMRWLHNEGR